MTHSSPSRTALQPSPPRSEPRRARVALAPDILAADDARQEVRFLLLGTPVQDRVADHLDRERRCRRRSGHRPSRTPRRGSPARVPTCHRRRIRSATARRAGRWRQASGANRRSTRRHPPQTSRRSRPARWRLASRKSLMRVRKASASSVYVGSTGPKVPGRRLLHHVPARPIRRPARGCLTGVPSARDPRHRPLSTWPGPGTPDEVKAALRTHGWRHPHGRRSDHLRRCCASWRGRLAADSGDDGRSPAARERPIGGRDRSR